MRDHTPARARMHTRMHARMHALVHGREYMQTHAPEAMASARARHVSDGADTINAAREVLMLRMTCADDSRRLNNGHDTQPPAPPSTAVVVAVWEMQRELRPSCRQIFLLYTDIYIDIFRRNLECLSWGLSQNLVHTANSLLASRTVFVWTPTPFSKFGCALAPDLPPYQC